jgi:copper chaperone CopZ
VQRELGSLPGVIEVLTNGKRQLVTVTLDAELITANEVKRQVEIAGFPSEYA